MIAARFKTTRRSDERESFAAMRKPACVLAPHCHLVLQPAPLTPRSARFRRNMSSFGGIPP
jgi:hypothetical protein